MLHCVRLARPGHSHRLRRRVAVTDAGPLALRLTALVGRQTQLRLKVTGTTAQAKAAIMISKVPGRCIFSYMQNIDTK